MSRDSSISDEELARYVRGNVSDDERASIESGLADPGAARRLEAMRTTVSALEYREPWTEQVDLVPQLRARIADGAGMSRRSRRWGLPMVFGTALGAAAATLVFFVLSGRGGEDAVEAEFRAKSGSGGVAADRWVGVKAYRPVDGRAPVPVEGRLEPGPLLFSYTNQGPEPFGYLMVLAVDSAGEIRWFYPAFVDANANPTSIAIERGTSDILLPELVEHDFSSGVVVIRGLFTRRPMSVAEVERIVQEHGAAASVASGPERLPIEDSGQAAIRLEVP